MSDIAERPAEAAAEALARTPGDAADRELATAIAELRAAKAACQRADELLDHILKAASAVSRECRP